MADPQSGGPPKRKRRPPPKKAVVEKIERVVPRLSRVTFGGGEMKAFSPPRPAAHIKLMFVPEGETWSPGDPDAPRPPSRTYTPRRYDAQTHQLEVELVHHGDGLAANWVQSAKPGDEIFIGGPGGGFDVPESIRHAVLVADETAMPGAGTILDVLPADCDVRLLCEVVDADDERELGGRTVTPAWLHRAPGNAVPGTMLEQAVRDLPDLPDDTVWWVACEAAAMRRIRSQLLNERRVDKARMQTRGYWRLGETNYPDHDYGED